MDNMIHLSGLLADRRVEILERWTQRIGREHVDKELSRGELRDHLPRFFATLPAAQPALLTKAWNLRSPSGVTRIERDLLLCDTHPR